MTSRLNAEQSPANVGEVEKSSQTVTFTVVDPNAGKTEASSSEIIWNLKKELKGYKERVIQQDIRIFEMTALLQSGKGLSNIRNLAELLDTFMAVVRERYNAVNACVLLAGGHAQKNQPTSFQVRRYQGLDPFFTDSKNKRESLYLYKFIKDRGLLWQIVQQGDVFSVRNMLKEPRFETAWNKWNLDVLRSDIWCPLIISGEVLGILTLGSREDGSQIPESEYSFLQELAAIASTIIDSTLKYEKNQRILKNIQTLYEVNQQLAQVTDFKAVCKRVLWSAVQALGAQNGNLMLMDQATRQLKIEVVSGHIPDSVSDGINEGSLATKPFGLGEGAAGQAAESRKPVLLNDPDDILQVGENPAYCILSVPLINGGEIEGVINITNKVNVDENGKQSVDPLGRFSEDDVSLMQGIADQAATCLHKSRLYSASITDRLTGLSNLRHFEEVLQLGVSEAVASGRHLVLAITDIDHFKKFNDTYGHKAGDFVLQNVARILQDCCRKKIAVDGPSDAAFRYGGEEFCMILWNTSMKEAFDVLEAFRGRVQQEVFSYNGQTMKVTVSVGLASTSTHGATTKELFTTADECLYSCKENGRNQVRPVKSEC